MHAMQTSRGPERARKGLVVDVPRAGAKVEARGSATEEVFAHFRADRQGRCAEFLAMTTGKPRPWLPGPRRGGTIRFYGLPVHRLRAPHARKGPATGQTSTTRGRGPWARQRPGRSCKAKHLNEGARKEVLEQYGQRGLIKRHRSRRDTVEKPSNRRGSGVQGRVRELPDHARPRSCWGPLDRRTGAVELHAKHRKKGQGHDDST